MSPPDKDVDRLKAENLLLASEKLLRETLALERKTSNDAYAIKMVERIVFGALGFVALAVLGAIVALVVK